MTDKVRAALIRTHYGQMGNQAYASVVVTCYMAGTAWAFTAHSTILAWLAAQIALQSSRQMLLREWRNRKPTDQQLDGWARLYTVYMTVSGVLWGSTIFLFAHPEQPITVALTLCGLYGTAGGMVPGNAYHPPCVIALVGLTFAPVVVRLIATGDFEFILLGVASFLFALTMLGVLRVHYRILREGFRIRFENVELVEQLARERTEADDARQAAEQANLAKSQFLAAASHDLRQPLYALGLFSSSLDQLRLDEDGRNVVRRIQDSIGVMEDSFDGLLDLSKLEAGVVQPRLAPVDVDALFDRISQVFRPLALDRGLDLRFRSDGELVTSDSTLLEQVISNLVSNAIRATTNGGVLIAARRRGDRLRFEIRDTGRGIAAEDVKRIFDEYVQIDNPERNRRRGLGLGLAIARRSVALLGSEIDVASRPGRGSCFGFAQPLCAAGESEAPSARMDGMPIPRVVLDRRRDLPLLIVEDDDDVRAALSDLLGRWGFALEAVADAEQGLERLRADRFGLLLTDHRLSGPMTGLDLIHAIRAADADAPPAILITGEVDSPLLSSAAQQGVTVLHKPVQAAQLHRLLSG